MTTRADIIVQFKVLLNFELMLISQIYDYQSRLKSYKITATAYDSTGY